MEDGKEEDVEEKEEEEKIILTSGIFLGLSLTFLVGLFLTSCLSTSLSEFPILMPQLPSVFFKYLLAISFIFSNVCMKQLCVHAKDLFMKILNVFLLFNLLAYIYFGKKERDLIVSA